MVRAAPRHSPGENRDVLEAAERAHGHLAEDREAEPVGFRPLPRERIEARDGAAQQRPHGKAEQDRVGQEDHDAAGVVEPLADVEAAYRDRGDGHHDASGEEQGGPAAGGEPVPRGAEHECEVGRDDKDDGADDDHGVDPEVPGDEEAGHLAEALSGPLIESAFQGHQAIEVDDDGGEGQVEREHGYEPEDYVGAAEFGGDTNPARTYDAEDLREDEVAESEFFAEFHFHGFIMMA